MPDTVESGMTKISAISGPVKRSRRNAAIAWTRCSSVRLATRDGVEERSTSPSSPSTRYRETHLRAQRTLTSAASAAFVSVHSCSSTRWQSTLRLLKLKAALACSFIRCPPWDWWRQAPPASKGARMNQPAQELQLAGALEIAGAVDALVEHGVAVVADVAGAVEADIEPLGAHVDVAGAV